MSNEIWLDLKCCWTKWNYLHWIRSALIRPYPMLNLPLEHLINLIRLLLACLGQSVAHVCQHGHPPETDTITKKQISYGKWQTATQPSRFDPGTIKLRAVSLLYMQNKQITARCVKPKLCWTMITTLFKKHRRSTCIKIVK